MTRKSKWIAIVALAGAVTAVGVGTGTALAGGGPVAEPEGPETAITGAELDKATDAALKHTGGGRVTETEVGDEESYYEVEVTLDDGRQVDVQLDKGFNVVGTETGNDTADDK